MMLRRTMILCGRFVFAMTIAPMFFKICTSTASSWAGAKHLPTYPKVVSTPLTLNWSFSVIGIPCRGPLSFPVSANSTSSCFACPKASSKRISVRLFVYSCKITSVSWSMEIGTRMKDTYQLMCNHNPTEDISIWSIPTPIADMIADIPLDICLDHLFGLELPLPQAFQ